MSDSISLILVGLPPTELTPHYLRDDYLAWGNVSGVCSLECLYQNHLAPSPYLKDQFPKISILLRPPGNISFERKFETIDIGVEQVSLIQLWTRAYIYIYIYI